MSISVVQTQTMEVVSSDLQERLRPATMTTTGNSTGLRKRGQAVQRRFSFIWPFVSKEMASPTTFSTTSSHYWGPQSLSERCGQLLRQFPSYFSGRAITTSDSSAIRDTIERSLTQAKAAWLVVAVYLALALLAVLFIATGIAFVGASKPVGLWFLVSCVAATGAIACVTMRTRPSRC